MISHSPCIVIVDRFRAYGCGLRNALIGSGSTVHVFSGFAPALALAERKRVDTVVVEFDADRKTTEFCEALKELHVPVVFLPPPIDAGDIQQYGLEMAGRGASLVA